MGTRPYGVFNLSGNLSRVYAITVTAYFMDDMAIWDARVYYRCPCCLNSTWADYPNITFERLAHLRRLSKQKKDRWGVGFVLSGRLDSYLRFKEDDIGAYAFNNYGIYWMNYPIPTLIAEDMWTVGKYQARVLSEWALKKMYNRKALEALRGIHKQFT